MKHYDSDFGGEFGDVVIHHNDTYFRYEVYVSGEDEYGTRREICWTSKYFLTKEGQPGITHFLQMLIDSVQAHT